MCGNLRDFEISTDTSVSFRLSQGNDILLDATYSPSSNGIVSIKIKDIVKDNLSYDLRDVDHVYVQENLAKDFTCLVGDQTVTFRAVRAGVRGWEDEASTYLTVNWLTWQPQVYKTVYALPLFLTYYATFDAVVKCEGHGEKDTDTNILTLGNIAQGTAATVPVRYSTISGLLGYHPTYYDVWIENADGTRISYIQRYTADNYHVKEQWFLFENSLGGLDSLRAFGDLTTEQDNTHNIAEMAEQNVEYHVDTKTKYTKNTGFLTDRQRQWLLDFAPSMQKYIIEDGWYHPIVVTDSSISYAMLELPSNFSFTFQRADTTPYLKIDRVKVDERVDLDIEVPEVGNFSLAPRLVEFPKFVLNEGLLIPIQSPNSETWGATTFEALAKHIADQVNEDKVKQEERFRGNWSKEVALSKDGYENSSSFLDIVYHNGVRWSCAITGTEQEPWWNSTGWNALDGEYRADIASSRGFVFRVGKVKTTLIGKLYFGAADITADLTDRNAVWTRISTQETEDMVWNREHASSGLNIPITDWDLPSDFSEVRTCTFKVSITLGATSINNELTINV